MAYVDFANFTSARRAFGEAGLVARPPESPATLSALEWSVVALARKDRLSSLSEPSRMASALGVLFGDRPNPRLADPKLEALRRLSVHAWHHGYGLPSNEYDAFLDAGFTSGQLEQVLASISRGRAARNQGHHA